MFAVTDRRTEAMTKDRIIRELLGLGIGSGDTLLVHSFLKSLGLDRPDIALVPEVFLEVLGEKGTLLMPALSYSTVTREQPFFSAADTPSCVGALTEYFRTMPGSVRSLHPTHSVCASGYRVVEMTRYHGRDITPVGENSPFRLLPDYGGKILFLGYGLSPNTSVHGIEETVMTPYVLLSEKVAYRIRNNEGITEMREHYVHDFEGWIQRYDRMESVLDQDELKRGNLLAADCYVMDAAALWKKGTELLKSDPYSLVEPKDR